MHTNENIYDTFIPRWFGRLGNNIQQISNGIYFCQKNEIHFTSPDHPMIKAIDLPFGTKEYKISDKSHNWFYFFKGPDADFDADISDLNLKRKHICEEFILPNLKIDFVDLPLDDDICVAHIRSGDVYSPRSHPFYVQNPLLYYYEILNIFNGKVIFITEDDNSPITIALRQFGQQVHVLPTENSYELLLRARNIATSGVGTYAVSAAFCSKNIKKLYCTNLWLDDALNPTMLKEHLDVLCADINDNKYIKIGGWNYTGENVKTILEYDDPISFRRL